MNVCIYDVLSLMGDRLNVVLVDGVEGKGWGCIGCADVRFLNISILV
jgi:hypothetical protein